MTSVNPPFSSSRASRPVRVHVAGSARLAEIYRAALMDEPKVEIVDQQRADVLLCMVERREDLACFARAKPAFAVLSVGPTQDAELEKACLDAGALGHFEGDIAPLELVAWLSWAARKGQELCAVVNEGLRVDAAAREARWRGVNLRLSPRDFEVFAYLAKYPGRIVPRRQLEQHVWEGQLPAGSRTLDVRIANIRKALARTIGDEPGPHIETIEKIGYRLNVP